MAFASMAIHHYFYRSASTGVLLRGGLINAIHNRSLCLTTRARSATPNGKLGNHMSTDVLVNGLYGICAYFLIMLAAHRFRVRPFPLDLLDRNHRAYSGHPSPSRQSRPIRSSGHRVLRPHRSNARTNHESFHCDAHQDCCGQRRW